MGDVVAAGFTKNDGTEYGPTVVKFSGVDGTELWRQVINGTAVVVSQATAVRTDDAGDVVAAGIGVNTGTGFGPAVVKFDGVSGTELWRQSIKGTANGADIVRSVAVDSFRNVVVTGYTFNERRWGDFTVVKLDGASGTELWRQIIRGTGYGASEAAEVTVDGKGDVLAVGFTVNAGTGGDFTVVKFDGLSGAELWRTVISGNAAFSFDLAHAVTVDSTGNVVAAGYIVNSGTQDDFFVVKLDGASGAELWRQVINGSASGRDQARAVAVDARGDVVGAGFIVDIARADFFVVKFDGVTGAELWRQVIKGTANGADLASAVTVDADGNVIAAGSTENTLTGADFTVVKFDGTTGAELWRKVINGTANDTDAAFAVTVDAAGDVVAVGRTANVGTGDDFTVVKLRGIDGSDF
jgi:hypothetical protein